MSEEVQKDDGAKQLRASSNTIPISPYSNIKREISEEDLKSPAVQRILLGEVDKLENRTLELEDILRTNNSNYNELNNAFHKADKEKGILEEKLKTNRAQEILYSFCLTSGAIIIGLAKMVWDDGLGGIFLGLGLFLTIGGVISKAVKWK